MRIAFTITFLIFCISSIAQTITYNDLVSLDWNDHPFSLAEMLIEKGYKYGDQQLIDSEIFEPGTQTRESLYQMSYTFVTENNASAAYVCVDEMSTDNISDDWPVVKLRFMHISKALYTKLENEIKEACNEPQMGMYISPESLAFILDKELIEGEPSYYILVYHITKDELEAIDKAVEEMLEELLKDE